MTGIPWTTEEICMATGGTVRSSGGGGRFDGIAIDSRSISKTDLFVAIKGEVHDGHTFVDAVAEGGAAGIIVENTSKAASQTDRWERKGITCITVKETTAALGALAAYNRKRAGITVVAITGSNGKTTTREMAAAVVSQRYETLVPQGNFNNEIGLPLTLLALSRRHRLAVLELGMNHPGEIRRLGQICRPDIGMITNIGPAHLEGVGSIDGVKEAKAELLETISTRGTVVLNADDKRVAGLDNRAAGRKVLFFGSSQRSHVRASDIAADAGGVSFRLHIGGDATRIRLKTTGAFMVANAAGAAAAGHELGLTVHEIKQGLESFRPVGKRLNLIKLGSGIRVVDDTYNANPGSMRSAIETLSSLRGDQRAILVVGDMLELGKHADALHQDIGAAAGRSGVTRLYITGAFAESVATGAAGEKMDPGRIFIGGKEEILSDLTDRLQPGDWVLVKGSRGMKMETVVDGLKRWAETVTHTQ